MLTIDDIIAAVRKGEITEEEADQMASGLNSQEQVAEGTPTPNPKLNYEDWIKMGQQLGFPIPAQQGEETPPQKISNGNPADNAAIKPVNSTQAALLGKATTNKPTYEQYLNWVNESVGENDNKVSRADIRNAREKLGMSRRDARQFMKKANAGEDVSKYTSKFQKRSYVDSSGKQIFEGDIDQDVFNNTYNQILNDPNKKGWAGLDAAAVGTAYNKSIDDWKADSKNITYDPISGKVTKTGFNGGNAVDITNDSEFKAQVDAARQKWFEENKTKEFAFNSEDGSYSFNGQKMNDASWLNEDFTKKLRAQDYVNDVKAYGETAKFGDTYGVKGDWTKLEGKLNLDSNMKKSPEYEEKYRQALDDYLKDYTLKNGSVAGSALYNYLQEQGLLHVGKGTDVTMNPNHPWLKAQQVLSPVNNEMYNLKIGGTLNTKKMRNYYKSGGAIEKYQQGGGLRNAVTSPTGKAIGGAALEAGKRMIPIYGTYLDWKDFANNPSLANLASAGLSTLGDATMLFGGAGTVFKGMAAARKVGKAADAVNDARKAYTAADKAAEAANAASKVYSKAKGADKARKAELAAEAASKEAARTAEKTALTKAEKELRTLKNTRNAPWNNLKSAYQHPWDTVKSGYNRQLMQRGMGAITGGYNYLNPTQNETPAALTAPQQVAVPQQEAVPQWDTYTPVRSSSNYQATGNDWFYKQGGNINMNKINYFQEGGAMAPAQAAPAQGGQDIQTQVMQLVQAAMSGDEQATQAIQQIMQAAQQGDQQAAQLAQMIQEIAQQMQGQAQAAKRGAKLSYIHSLNTGCPSGYEVQYNKKGGKVCKECVAKAQQGGPVFVPKGKPTGAIYGEPANNPHIEDDGTVKISNYQKGRIGGRPAGMVANYVANPDGTFQRDTMYYSGNNVLPGGVQTESGYTPGDVVFKERFNPLKRRDINKAPIDYDKSGGELKKKLCGGKKLQNGAKVAEEKCGGKAKKKCAEGGTLTLKELRAALNTLNK